MKKLYMLCLLFLALCTALKAQNRKFLGTWESTDSTETVQMILDDKGYLTFKTGNQLMGGIGYNVDGQILSMRYRIAKVNGKDKITISIRDLKTKELLKRDTGTISHTNSNNIEVCFTKTLESNAKADDCRKFLKIK
ncbi:MAG: hypothetical protein ACWA5P_00585 [bacterium]